MDFILEMIKNEARGGSFNILHGSFSRSLQIFVRSHSSANAVTGMMSVSLIITQTYRVDVILSSYF